VLHRVLVDLVEARSADIALAKLRGFRRAALIRFGLGEPIVLLLAAVPVGAALAFVGALLLTRAVLLPGTRALLEQADALRRTAKGLSSAEAVRLGYVNWRPADLEERASGVAHLVIDPWVMPSHAQAARVADGSLDLAVCWVRTEDLKRLGLRARLLGADRLYAVARGGDSADVPDVAARDTDVLIDDDITSWASWNAYGEELAEATGARTVRISDGAITGPAFFDHVRRCTRPVVNSPKGQTDPLPADLVRREIVAPKVYWTWSLVWRESEERAGVLATVDALCDGVGDLGLDAPDAWLPADDPYALPG